MKFLQKSSLELDDTYVSDQFILNYMNTLEGIDIKLYLYILFLSKKGIEIDKAGISKKLMATEQELNFSLDRLQAEELIVKTSNGFKITDLKEVAINKSYTPKMEPKNNKSQTEQEKKRIAAAAAINESYFQGMMTLMWYSDIELMFKNYCFSEEVMIALFQYCQERKALNRKYVLAVAESWYKGNVKTFEQLEDFLETYDNIQKTKQKIVKALGLNRNISQYEEPFINAWIKEYNYKFDMIEQALKRAVLKGTPSISYVNGILSNWHKKGYTSVKDLENETREFENKKVSNVKINKSAPKTKYQNYEQREYEDLESFYDNI